MSRLPEDVRSWLSALQKFESKLNPTAPKPLVSEVSFTECACGKTKPIEELGLQDSGVVKFVNNICAGCEHMAEGLATIICVKCRRVLGRVKPLKDKLGFEFKAGRVYHVECCPKCIPKTEKALIIEMLLFYKKIGFKP